MHRRVGVRQNGDPLVGEHGGAVVQIRADVDRLDADIAVKQAEAADLVAGAEAAGGGAGVAGFVEQQLAVLCNVGIEVGAVGHQAERLAAPEVLGSPEPALPGVRVADLHGEAAEQVEQLEHTAVGAMDHLGLAMAVALRIDGVGAIFLDDAADLALDDVEGLIPADALVAADAAGLRMALAVGIPVHALDGVQDAVRRVDALFPGDAHRAAGRLGRRLQHLAAGFDPPGVDVLVGILPVIAERTDAENFSILHIDGRDVGAVAERRVARTAEGSKGAFLVAHCGFLLLLASSLRNTLFISSFFFPASFHFGGKDAVFSQAVAGSKSGMIKSITKKKKMQLLSPRQFLPFRIGNYTARIGNAAIM